MVVLNPTILKGGRLMEKFIARHRALVSSVLTGFDRLVFRGSLRALHNSGIYGFLSRTGVRVLDFGKRSITWFPAAR